MIKEYLLSTSGQQRAAPSRSYSLLQQVLVPSHSSVNCCQVPTKYRVLSTKYQVPAGNRLLPRMLALTSDLRMLLGSKTAVHT